MSHCHIVTAVLAVTILNVPLLSQLGHLEQPVEGIREGDRCQIDPKYKVIWAFYTFSFDNIQLSSDKDK